MCQEVVGGSKLIDGLESGSTISSNKFKSHGSLDLVDCTAVADVLMKLV